MFPSDLRLRSGLWKPILASGSTQAPPNLISLTILVTSKNLTQFQSKVRAIKLEISAEMRLTWQLLYDILTEVEIRY